VFPGVFQQRERVAAVLQPISLLDILERTSAAIVLRHYICRRTGEEEFRSDLHGPGRLKED
jgi:hypothetical protein